MHSAELLYGMRIRWEMAGGVEPAVLGKKDLTDTVAETGMLSGRQMLSRPKFS